jgi:hypothetical protein
MKNWVLIFTVALLTACAQQVVWTKPGLNQQEFARDKYACVQDSRSYASSGSMTSSKYLPLQADYQSGEVINGNVFKPCMESKGYSLVSARPSVTTQTMAAQLKVIGEKTAECIRAVRRKPEYQGLASHFPDRTGNYTLQQLSDQSLPTTSEARAMTAYSDEAVSSCNRPAIEELGRISPAIGAITQRSLAASQDAVLLVVQRKVTWGEFAQKAKGLREDYRANLSQVRL